MENGRVLDEYRKALMEIYNLSKTQPLDFKKKITAQHQQMLLHIPINATWLPIPASNIFLYRGIVET